MIFPLPSFVGFSFKDDELKKKKKNKEGLGPPVGPPHLTLKPSRNKKNTKKQKKKKINKLPKKLNSGHVLPLPSFVGFSFNRSLKNYQYSTEGQALHDSLAPVLVIISGRSLVLSRSIITSTGFLPVLRPRRVSTTSGNKSVSRSRMMNEKATQRVSSTWWTFRIFLIFFSAQGRGRGSPRREGGGGVGFLLKIPEGRGSPRREGGVERAGRVSAGYFGGGGAKRKKQPKEHHPHRNN